MLWCHLAIQIAAVQFLELDPEEFSQLALGVPEVVLLAAVEIVEQAHQAVHRVEIQSRQIGVSIPHELRVIGLLQERVNGIGRQLRGLQRDRDAGRQNRVDEALRISDEEVVLAHHLA